jgi:virginiamycin B lyase
MTRQTRLLARLSATTCIGTLALLAALVSALALAPRAEAFIYWGYNSKGYEGITRASLNGTFEMVPTPAGGGFIDGVQSPISIAVDERYIYWAGYGHVDEPTEPDAAIARARLDGTKRDWTFIPAAAAGLSEGVGEIAVVDDHIYWVRGGLDPSVSIDRAKLDGTGIERGFITGFTEGAVVTGIALDDNHLYWSQTGGTGPTSTQAPAIGRVNLDGSGINRALIPLPEGVEPLAVEVDAAHIYWSAMRRGHDPSGAPEEVAIGRANLDGTEVDQGFIAGFPYGHVPDDLAVDAGHIYWANHRADMIGRANLDGSGMEASFIGPASLSGGLAVNFSVGKPKKNKKRGTARLTVEVPAPGDVELAETTKVGGAELRAVVAGEVQLAIKPRGRAKKKLAEKGKVKVKAEVTYTPDGGEPEEQIATLRLKR